MLNMLMRSSRYDKMETFMNREVKGGFAAVIDELKSKLARQGGRFRFSARNAKPSDFQAHVKSRHQQEATISSTSSIPSGPSYVVPLPAFMSSPVSTDGNPGISRAVASLNLPPSPPQSPKAPKQATSISSTPSTPSTPSLTPASLLEIVKRTKNGEHLTPGSAYSTYPLTPRDHETFNTLLDNDEDDDTAAWYRHKFRHDWDPEASTYTIRMPTPLHEIFIRSFIAELVHQIRSLAVTSPELAPVVSRIRDGGSPSIKLHHGSLVSSQEEEDAGTAVARCPDGTLWYETHGLPSTVLEVSYSQKRKDLPYLADSYIVDSQHDIQTVIGLDIEYLSTTTEPEKRNKLATISVWRPEMLVDDDGEDVGACKTVQDAVPFRSRDGSCSPGAFEIALAALLPVDVATEHPEVNRHVVTISHARLAEMLDQAEEMHHMIKAREGAPAANKKPGKWRKRRRTPPEELSSGAESRFAHVERAAEDKAAKEDGDWGRRAKRRVR